MAGRRRWTKTKLLGGIEPPSGGSEPPVITATLQKLGDVKRRIFSILRLFVFGSREFSLVEQDGFAFTRPLRPSTSMAPEEDTPTLVVTIGRTLFTHAGRYFLTLSMPGGTEVRTEVTLQLELRNAPAHCCPVFLEAHATASCSWDPPRWIPRRRCRRTARSRASRSESIASLCRAAPSSQQQQQQQQ